MKTTFLTVSFILGLACFLRADELPWQYEYDKALEQAKMEHRPVFLDFSASWCGPCRMMEHTTFADKTVQTSLHGYLLVKVDLDANPALAAKYSVNAIPACILLNQFGEKTAQHVGYVDAKTFSDWLDKHEPEAFAKESQSEIDAARLAALDKDLESPDANARNRGIALLLEIYNKASDAEDKGPGDIKMVETELRKFVAKYPAAAADLLNDGRLSVRILFASLLAEKVGAGFQFDPWGKAAARAMAAEQCKKQIVGTP